MSDVEISLARNDTLHKHVLHNEHIRGSDIGFQEKDLAIWQSYTWLETADKMRGPERVVFSAESARALARHVHDQRKRRRRVHHG